MKNLCGPYELALEAAYLKMLADVSNQPLSLNTEMLCSKNGYPKSFAGTVKVMADCIESIVAADPTYTHKVLFALMHQNRDNFIFDETIIAAENYREKAYRSSEKEEREHQHLNSLKNIDAYDENMTNIRKSCVNDVFYNLVDLADELRDALTETKPITRFDRLIETPQPQYRRAG